MNNPINGTVTKVSTTVCDFLNDQEPVIKGIYEKLETLDQKLSPLQVNLSKPIPSAIANADQRDMNISPLAVQARKNLGDLICISAKLTEIIETIGL